MIGLVDLRRYTKLFIQLTVEIYGVIVKDLITVGPNHAGCYHIGGAGLDGIIQIVFPRDNVGLAGSYQV